ncbi:hypothetical protein OH768_07785 [Streptomyces sp. NBC_01622]|uniref:IS110 family transposase n=1 Tax=Streptomyces sp. NBC_01622 TaxID=2975903 RepID=UPI00386436A4|nr:hypothetical protein OH768_07785 [Streptomyces sp. NBC_01622]
MFSERTSVGLNVHARSTTAWAVDGTIGEIFSDRLVANTADVVAWVRRLPQPAAVAYEAAPAGFVLARALQQAGIRCVVAAPSKMERPAGDRIKTDKRDAQALARLLRLDELPAVQDLHRRREPGHLHQPEGHGQRRHVPAAGRPPGERIHHRNHPGVRGRPEQRQRLLWRRVPKNTFITSGRGILLGNACCMATTGDSGRPVFFQPVNSAGTAPIVGIVSGQTKDALGRASLVVSKFQNILPMGYTGVYR